MAGIDNASKYRSKEDEERLARQKAKAPTNVKRAKELAKQYSNPYKFSNNKTVAKTITGEKWYSGNTPTARETYARMYTVAGGDDQKMSELQNQYMQEASTRGSVLYNPYSQATNYKAIQGLAALGVDVPDKITDQWIDNMWSQYGKYSRETTTGYGPSAPSSKSTRENDIAYWVGTLLEDKDTTNLAEAQLGDMYKEVEYLTKQGYSDAEVLKRVRADFGSKYNVLNNMDNARLEGDAVRLNRKVDYMGDDTIYGMIWAARNGGSSGDYLADAAAYTLGWGNKYKPDPNSEAALDPSNYEGYDPYSRGSTLHDMNMKYGADSYSREWLEQNRTMLSDPEQAKDWRKISDAVDNAEKAEAELAELDKWVEKQINRGMSADDIADALKVLIENGGDEYGMIKVPTLKSMEEKRYAGDALAMAYGVNFTLPQYVAKASDMIAERDVAAEQAEAEKEAAEGEKWYNTIGQKISQWFTAGGVQKGDYDDLHQIKAGLDAQNKEFDSKAESVMDAEHGAMTADDMLRSYASAELGVDITGDLTDEERALVDDTVAKVEAASRMGATAADREAANAAIAVLNETAKQIAADPSRVNSYESSEAYNSVINRKPEEPREGMAELTAEPTAYTGVAEQVAQEDQAYEQAFTKMFQGGEWDFDAFKWAYGVSDNPKVVEAELVEGIMSLMRGEKPANGFAQSWWNKFQGMTANTNPTVRHTGLSQGERDVHSQNPEQFDSRHQYGSQVYDALINNQKAYDAGAISDKAYVHNLILLSDAANEISLAADGGRATDELAAEVLGANNGEYQAVLDAVNAYCDEGINLLEQEQQKAQEATIGIVERYKRGDELDMQGMAVISQIKGWDVGDVSKQDSTYQDMLGVFDAGLSFDSVMRSDVSMEFTYGSPELDANHSYEQMMDAGATAYAAGVNMIARDLLDDDMRFAAACGLTLGEYYEKYPEFSRSGEQILEAAQSEYETTWGEFGKTISGMLEANESIREDGEEVQKGEDTITIGDLFGLSADTAQRALDLSVMKTTNFLLYSANSPEEKSQRVRQKYGNDAEAYRADVNEVLKGENERLQGVYNMDATKGERTFDEWKKEHPEAANLRQLEAQMSANLDIFGLGMTPDEIKRSWKIANTSGTIANTSKLVAEHGSEFEGKMYDFLVSGQNSAVTMFATAALGAAGVSTALASFLATGKDYMSNAYDRYQATGNADAAFWSSAAEWVVGSQIERMGFEQYMPDSMQSNWANKVARGMHELSSKGFAQIIRDPKSMSKIGKGFIGGLMQSFANGGGEFAEEFSQAYVSAMADNYVYGEKILPSTEQLSEAGKEGVMAFFMAPVFTAASGNTHSFTDIHGDIVGAAEALLLPEHDGTILNDAIDFEATLAAIHSSSEALAEIENSSENAAKKQAATDLQAANAELAEAQAELTAAQEAETAAAVALEDANVEMQDSDAFTEDLRERMTAAAEAIQKAKEHVAKVNERVRAAAEKQAEAQQRHEEAKAKVQAMYDAVMEEAKAKARQLVTDLFFGGDSEAQQAASQKYLDACERLLDAKNRLRSAKADAEMYARGTPRGDDAHTAYGEALLEVEALIEEVAAAKAEVDAAYAETAEGKMEAAQNEELTTAAQAAEQARAEAEADPMNAKKQAKAELEEAKLRTIRAKQTMDEKRHGISQRLTDPRSNVREEAVNEWNALQAETDAAAAESEALQAEYDKTDAQKQLAGAIEEAKGYTKEQVLFADEPGHVQAVRARNKLALAKADVEVENAYNALDNADAGTPEYDAALTAYNEAVEAREDEVGRQMGTTGDAVREMLRKSPLGEQVMDAVKQGNQTRAANLIEQIMNSNPERRAELAKQAVKQRQPLQLREDAETGARGKAGVTKAYSKAAGKRLTSDARMQLRILDELAKDSGFEIVVKDSISKVKGAINGMLAKGGTIYIGLDAIEQGYLQAGTHEIVHGIRGRDEAAYNELKQVVTEVLSEQGLSIDQLVQDRIDSYATAGQQLTEDGALEEIIAESAAQIWGSEANLKKFADEHPTAFKRVYDAFMQFWKKVQDISARIAQRNDRKEITAMLSDDGAMQKVYDAFMKVAKEADVQQKQEAVELSDSETKFSLRTEEPPVKTGVAYKVFFEKDGKLYPPMVANPGGADTPVGVWLNADIGVAAPPSKTGRMQVKAGGKGTQGGSGSLAFRPGWHLGDIPKATQFNRLNPETGVKELFPANFVWAECEYAADVDYQEEAMSYGYTENGKFRHSYAGLPRLPENGYYRYRTNPNPDTVPWIITGAMKVNRILSHEEVDAILAENGIEPTKWQDSSKYSLNQWSEDEPALAEGSIANEYYGALSRPEWKQYYNRLSEDRSYDTSLFAPDDRTVMVVNGNLIAMKMQGNREFTVTGVYRGDGIEYNSIISDEVEYLVNRWMGDRYGEEDIVDWHSVVGQDDGEPVFQSYDKHNGWAVSSDGAEKGSGAGASGLYRNGAYGKRILDTGAGEDGGSLSLNESAQNHEIANDLAGQLVNNTDNAMEIADILSRISGDMWRDHRTPARTGEQTTADRNPIEILSDLTRSIRVGYNPGGTVSVDGERVPRAVLGVYERLASSITTRTSDAGDLELGLHEFGHAVHDRLTGFQANDRLMDSLSQDVRDAYDRPQWEGEAIAEFVIDYIFSRDAAINLAGDDFVREFENMLRQDRDLYNAIMEASHQVELWNNADPGSRMDAMVKNYTVDPRRREIGGWLSRQLRGLDTGLFDYTAPAKLVSRDFHRQALYSAHARKRSDTVLNQRLIDPSGHEIGQSLAERLYEAGVGEADMPAIVRFALARHALDRRNQNKDVFTPREFSTADLEAIVAEYADTNIEAGANALTSFWNDFMDAWMVDTGLIDRATIENMRAMYPHYVPTFRVVGENFNNFGGRQSTFQLREAVEGGSSLEVINPMISMVDQVQKVVNTVTNNQMMRAFHREMQRGGMGEIARLVPEREAVRHTDISRAMAAFQTAMQGSNANPDAVETAVRELAALEQQFIATGQGAGTNVVSGVDEYGNRFFYEVYDKPLFDLLSGNVHTASSVPEAVRRFKNTFTALTTGSNLLFAIKNAQRDFQASVNTGTWALTYADGMAKWIWALTEVFANSESYQQWKSMGGGSHSRFQSAMIDQADAGKLARQVSSALLRGRRTLTGQFKVDDTALERITQTITLEKLNTAIEDASRFAEWRFGRHDLSTDEGRMEAFMRSQDVTTNFGTHGAYKWIQTLNKIVPFMNATLQGTSKDIHIVADIFGTDNAARAEALPKAGKIIMNTALTAAFQMAILKSFAKGDEDDEDYALLSGAMKAGNLIIPMPQSVRESLEEFSGFSKPYIRIPIAQGALHQGMYAVMLNSLGNVKDYSPLEMDLMTTVMQIMAESVPTDGTIFQAYMDAKNNRTWYGKQIENSYMQSGSEYNRTKDGTSAVVTKLARALLMSPAKLDYMLNQYSGVIGKVAAPLLSGEGVRGLLNNVLSAYTVDPVTTNDLSDNFSSAKTLLEQTVTDGKRGDPLGNLAYGIDANAAFDEALYLEKYFEAANKEANALWAEYNEIRDSSGMSKGEQARAMRSIRQEINGVYADALAEFDSFKMQYVNRDWLAIETMKELAGFATKASVN